MDKTVSIFFIFGFFMLLIVMSGQAAELDYGTGLYKGSLYDIPTYKHIISSPNNQRLTIKSKMQFKMDQRSEANIFNKLTNQQQENIAKKPKTKLKSISKVKKMLRDKLKDKTKVIKPHEEYKFASIFFEFDSAKLNSESIKVLNSIDKDIPLIIYGYASPEGGTTYNDTLSQRRADAVKKVLQKRGLTIKASKGKGEKFCLLEKGKYSECRKVEVKPYE